MVEGYIRWISFIYPLSPLHPLFPMDQEQEVLSQDPSQHAPPQDPSAYVGADLSAPTGNFRFKRKSAFLTYSRVPSHFSRQTIAECLTALGSVRRLFVAREEHRDGHPHFHAYVEWERVVERRSPRFADCDGVHPNIRPVTDLYGLLEYLRKEDTDPLIVGDFAAKRGGLFAHIAERILAGDFQSPAELAREYPGFSLQHGGKLREFLELNRPLPPLPTESDFDGLWPWQRALAERCLRPAHPRLVFWRWCSAGNSGKSYLCSRLLELFGGRVLYVTGGTARDISEAWDPSRHEIILFDFARSLQDSISWQAIESLKNGMVFSSKYQSRTKRASRPPHVFCFANFPPPLDAHGNRYLSDDRWDVKDVGAEVRGPLPSLVHSMPSSPDEIQ